MFYPVQPTLSADVATNGTFTVPGVDAYRLAILGPHSLVYSGVIYRSPEDFTVDVSGLNVATVTWLNALTLPAGSKPALFLAVVDTIASGTSTMTDGAGSPIVIGSGNVSMLGPDSALGTFTFSALNDELIVDMSGYNLLSISVPTFPAASVVTVSGSDDGITNIQAIPIDPFGSPSGNGTLTQFSTTGAWTVGKKGRYIHIKLTTYGGAGSLSGQVVKSQAAVSARQVLVHGAVSEGSGASGYAVPVGGRVFKSALTSTYDTDGRRAELRLTAEGQVPTKPYAPRALDWNPAPTGSFTNDTAEHAIKALATGFRLNLTALQLSWSANSAGGTVTVLDATGGNTIFAYRLPQAEGGVIIPFPTPIVSQLSQGLFIKTPTALSGTVVWSAQGFTGGVS